MKKILSCALVCLLLAAVCAGCTRSGAEEDAFQPEETLQALLDSGAFSEDLEELDPVLLFYLSGDAGDYEGSLLYYSTGATSETAAVIAAKDAAQADTVKETLSAWVDAQIEATRDYQPAEVEKLEHAILETRGRTVLLVVAADWKTAEKAIPET